jgi:hypothetical protein
MAQSYFGAGAGQSGSVQSLGGAIAGLDSSNRDKMETQYYSDPLNAKANGYISLLKPKDLKKAYGEYKTAFDANNPIARENADFYADQAKGILSDGTRGADVYERLREGNLSSLSDVFKNVLDHGLASQKARLAAGGYGGSGPSSYDRILNSTITASNLSPVLQSIYGGLGPSASALISGDRTWDAYRMGQFAQDPLTGYVDNATAGRVFQPLQDYRTMIGGDIGLLSNLLNGVIKPNVSGYELQPGLGSKLNNVAAGVMNLANFGTSMYGNIAGGGMGGMLGGMGGGTGGTIPQTGTMQFSNPYNYGAPAYGVDVPATIPNTGYSIPSTYSTTAYA